MISTIGLHGIYGRFAFGKVQESWPPNSEKSAETISNLKTTYKHTGTTNCDELGDRHQESRCLFLRVASRLPGCRKPKGERQLGRYPGMYALGDRLPRQGHALGQVKGA